MCQDRRRGSPSVMAWRPADSWRADDIADGGVLGGPQPVSLDASRRRSCRSVFSAGGRRKLPT